MFKEKDFKHNSLPKWVGVFLQTPTSNRAPLWECLSFDPVSARWHRNHASISETFPIRDTHFLKEMRSKWQYKNMCPVLSFMLKAPLTRINGQLGLFVEQFGLFSTSSRTPDASNGLPDVEPDRKMELIWSNFSSSTIGIGKCQKRPPTFVSPLYLVSLHFLKKKCHASTDRLADCNCPLPLCPESEGQIRETYKLFNKVQYFGRIWGYRPPGYCKV